MKQIFSLVIILVATAITSASCGGLPPDVARSQQLFRDRQYQEARAAAQSALAQHPDHPVLWRVRVQATFNLGLADDAVAEYRAWHTVRGSHDHELLERLAVTTMWQGMRVPSIAVRIRTIQAIERLEIEKLAKDVDARVTDDNDAVAAAAAVALLRSSPGAADIATQLLRSDEAQARAIAVEGIGRKIGARARGDLLFSLRDPDARVRRAGALAIAAMKNPDDTARLRELATTDPDPEVRVAALAGLGMGQRQDAAKVALVVLASDRVAGQAAGSAPNASAPNASAPNASAPNASAPNGSAPDVSTPGSQVDVPLAGVRLLAALGDRSSLERISRDPGVRANAPWLALAARAALVRMGQPTASHDSALLDVTAAHAGFSGSWQVRVAVARELAAGYSGQAQALPLLDSLSSDPDGRVRVAAAAALAALGHARGREALSLLCGQPTLEVREAAISAHQELGIISLGLVDRLADESALLRVHAAEVLATASR